MDHTSWQIVGAFPFESNGRQVCGVPTQLDWRDRIGAALARLGTNRMNFRVEPSLYAVGEPNSDSPVLVTANYKLSFDALRKELSGLDAWLMVIDTKGINVWCAAGKGTFGTEEIVSRIKTLEVDKVVNHRTLILPQLGAPGVAAHAVLKESGFRVIYGPVRAADLKEFLDAGCEASEQMRQVKFTLYDRLILTPVEFMAGLKWLFAALAAFLAASGISRSGYDPGLILTDGFRAAVNLLTLYLGGTVLAPMLLPWLPGRSFSLKGLEAGTAVGLVLMLMGTTGGAVESAGWVAISAAVGSFLTMNFTGSSTYTSLSGVRKEMSWALWIQAVLGVIGLGLWVVARFV